MLPQIQQLVKGQPLTDHQGQPEALHPLLDLYLRLRRWSPTGGPLIFPSQGGWAEQDLLVTLQLEWIGELFQEEQTAANFAQPGQAGGDYPE